MDEFLSPARSARFLRAHRRFESRVRARRSSSDLGRLASVGVSAVISKRRWDHRQIDELQTHDHSDASRLIADSSAAPPLFSIKSDSHLAT